MAARHASFHRFRGPRAGLIAGGLSLTACAVVTSMAIAPAALADPVATATSTPTAAASCGDLAVGSSGVAITTIQEMLGVSADGAFGPKTQAALEHWQTKHGVTASGVIDAATWAAMPEAVSWQACGEAVKATMPTGEKLHCTALAKGDVGPAVAVLQKAVGAGVDGGFGPHTRAAVEAAQKSHKLTVTGAAGRSLWKALGLTGTPACEPGPPATAPGANGNGGGSGGGGTPPPADEKKQQRIRNRVARIVANLSGPAQSASAITAAALGFAHDQLGKPYVYGAEGPSGYDCSGLAMAAYDAAAIAMPRTAAQQYSAGAHVPLADVQQGDLLYWGSDVTKPATIYHTAIYVGNGRILDAPHTGENVQVQQLWSTDLMPRVVRPTLELSLPVKRGDTGRTVTDLQSALDHHGYNVTVDGQAGPATIAAVKSWQRTNEVKATGRVTEKLWPTLGWLPPKPPHSSGTHHHKHHTPTPPPAH